MYPGTVFTPRFLRVWFSGERSVPAAGTTADVPALQRTLTRGDNRTMAMDASQNAPLAEQIPLYLQYAGALQGFPGKLKTSQSKNF